MNILPASIQIGIALVVIAFVRFFEDWIGALGNNVFYILLALSTIVFGYFLYRDWDTVKNGRLKITALTNYKGKYSGRKISELTIVINNPHWKKTAEYRKNNLPFPRLL